MMKQRFEEWFLDGGEDEYDKPVYWNVWCSAWKASQLETEESVIVNKLNTTIESIISNVVMRCYQECDTKAEAVKKIDEWLDLSGIGEVRDVLENKKY